MAKYRQVRCKGRKWCQIEVRLEDGKLSVCGVYGDGGAGETYLCVDRQRRTACSFGQCVEEIARFFPEYKPLLPWHLNDMRAGCVHQRANWNTEERVEVITYSLTSAAINERSAIKESAMQRLMAGECVQLTGREKVLLSLPWERHDAPDADSPASGCYEVTKREERWASQTYPKEHPKGFLCKPCEVCGYKYGSAWLREELPPEIVALAQSVGQNQESK